jgi:hypothetical protein
VDQIAELVDGRRALTDGFIVSGPRRFPVNDMQPLVVKFGPDPLILCGAQTVMLQDLIYFEFVVHVKCLVFGVWCLVLQVTGCELRVAGSEFQVSSFQFLISSF